MSVHNLKAAIWPLWYRFRFYADLPLVKRVLAYRKLRRKFYDKLWAETAASLDAEIELDNSGLTRITRNGLSTFVKQSQIMLDDHITLDVIGNKGLTYQLLSELGAPIVQHVVFSMHDLEEAERFVDEHSPVVVKPASGTGGGRGVTTGISTQDQFLSAARLAARSDQQLIVEKQVDGHSFRLLYLDGKFIDAIRRDPPTVIGDGVSTIKQLIKLENIRRQKEQPTCALSPLVIDKDARNWLNENNHSFKDVPAKDQTVQVKRAINENDKRENVNVTGLVNAGIISQCGELVEKLGVKFAGVDLICKDITGSFTSDNCYVSEINTTPGIHHHYLIANQQEGNPVARIALEYMFSNKVGVMDLGNPAMNPPGKHSHQHKARVEKNTKVTKENVDEFH